MGEFDTMMYVNNDPRVRALLAAARRGYPGMDEKLFYRPIMRALERVEQGATRMEQEIRKLEKPIRFW